ncbi:MAG: hypothetical protein Kow00129_05970 [Thermoleophilia bacterium]
MYLPGEERKRYVVVGQHTGERLGDAVDLDDGRIVGGESNTRRRVDARPTGGSVVR